MKVWCESCCGNGSILLIKNSGDIDYEAKCLDCKGEGFIEDFETERLAEIGRVTEYAISAGYDFAWDKDYFMTFEQMKKTMELETSQQATTSE